MGHGMTPDDGKPVALLVEDDPELQEQMCVELSRLGFDVRTALHYDAALEHLSKIRPKLALVDLELPTESGYDICQAIRSDASLADVPILVTSDSGFPEDMAFAEEAGANAFLQKPFDMKDLVRYVQALVTARKRSEPRMWRLRP